MEIYLELCSKNSENRFTNKINNNSLILSFSLVHKYLYRIYMYVTCLFHGHFAAVPFSLSTAV